MSAPNNEGTVKNTLKGIRASNGKYVKLLSPGDSFYDRNTLNKWIDQLEKSGAKWSFSDAIYYDLDHNGNRRTISEIAHPQDVNPYLKRNYEKCRWNYIVLGDITLGAAVLCDRTVYLDYLESIEGKVIYAEDNIYRLMMFDGIYPFYFDQAGIWYEYGSGISTSGSDIWQKRLYKDWEAATDIMLNRPENYSNLQAKMRKIMNSRYYNHKYISLIMVKGRLPFLIRKKMCPRMTNK